MLLQSISKFAFVIFLVFLSSCSGELAEKRETTEDGDGLVLLGNDRNPDGSKRRSVNIPGLGNLTGGGGQNTVNSYLWRSSLDTLARFPLATTDPFGGVIQTEWFAATAGQGQPGQEIKVCLLYTSDAADE